MTQPTNAFSAAQAYRSASVSVSPLSAIVMLLDGAITSLQKTMDACDKKLYEESHGHLIKATSIIRGLIHHLNFDKGGELAERLHSTYHSLILCSLTSFGRPDANERYSKVIRGLAELRDAWKFVAAIAGEKPKKAH